MLQKKGIVNHDKGKSDISDQVVVQLQSAQHTKKTNLLSRLCWLNHSTMIMCSLGHECAS